MKFKRIFPDTCAKILCRYPAQPEHRVRKRFQYPAFNLNRVLLLILDLSSCSLSLHLLTPQLPPL